MQTKNNLSIEEQLSSNLCELIKKYTDAPAIEKFLEKFKKFNINCQVVNGWAPMHYACRTGQGETIKVLLKFGGSLKGPSTDKMNVPLDLIIKYHPDLIEEVQGYESQLIANRTNNSLSSTNISITAQIEHHIASNVTANEKLLPVDEMLINLIQNMHNIEIEKVRCPAQKKQQLKNANLYILSLYKNIVDVIKDDTTENLLDELYEIITYHTARVTMYAQLTAERHKQDAIPIGWDSAMESQFKKNNETRFRNNLSKQSIHRLPSLHKSKQIKNLRKTVNEIATSAATACDEFIEQALNILKPYVSEKQKMKVKFTEPREISGEVNLFTDINKFLTENIVPLVIEIDNMWKEFERLIQNFKLIDVKNYTKICDDYFENPEKIKEAISGITLHVNQINKGINAGFDNCYGILCNLKDLKELIKEECDLLSHLLQDSNKISSDISQTDLNLPKDIAIDELKQTDALGEILSVNHNTAGKPIPYCNDFIQAQKNKIRNWKLQIKKNKNDKESKLSIERSEMIANIKNSCNMFASLHNSQKSTTLNRIYIADTLDYKMLQVICTKNKDKYTIEQIKKFVVDLGGYTRISSKNHMICFVVDLYNNLDKAKFFTCAFALPKQSNTRNDECVAICYVTELQAILKKAGFNELLSPNNQTTLRP